MSLYKFIESSIEENSDLAEINYSNPINYDHYYYYHRLNEKRFDIESFLNPLFFNNIVKCSRTIKEYDELKIKVRNIAQVSQKLFNLSFLHDKLEKERNNILSKIQ